jgi:hypothetical protein
MCHKKKLLIRKAQVSIKYIILIEEISFFKVRDNYCVVLDFFQLCRSILTLLFYQLFMWCVCIRCLMLCGKFFCVSLYHHSSFSSIHNVVWSFFFFWIKSICQFSVYVICWKLLMRFSLLVVALKLSQSLHQCADIMFGLISDLVKKYLLSTFRLFTHIYFANWEFCCCYY